MQFFYFVSLDLNFKMWTIDLKTFLSFQAPESYKNVTDVVNTCHDAGISKKAIKLRPIAVIKGWSCTIPNKTDNLNKSQQTEDTETHETNVQESLKAKDFFV